MVMLRSVLTPIYNLLSLNVFSARRDLKEARWHYEEIFMA